MKNLFTDDSSFDCSPLIDHIKTISKYELLRSYLPFLEILSDNKTIFTRNNTLIRVIKIEGIDNGNMSFEDQTKYFQIKNNLFFLVDPAIKLSFHTVRREQNFQQQESLKFSNASAQEISKIWNSQFEGSFLTENYLIISRTFPEITKNLNQFLVKLNSARKEFGFSVAQISDMLSAFGVRDLDNQNHYELFRFFSYLVNNHEFISKSQNELFSHLSLSDLTFHTSDGLVEIKNDRVKRFSKIIGVRVNTNTADENVIKSLLMLNYEFDIIQQVKLYTKEQNQSTFRSIIKSLMQLPQFEFVQSRVNELTEAMELVDSNQDNYLDYTCYIKVNATTRQELDEAVSQIQNTLTTEGTTSFISTLEVMLVFFAILPDLDSLLHNLQTSTRARISTKNTSDFVALHQNKAGFKRSPFGEEQVATFKTSDNGNYNFTFHKDESNSHPLGHTMIIGQSGIGKSTLTAFLLMNCLKFQNIKMLCFDSLQALQLPILAFDGKYVTVGRDTDLKLNPMTLPESFVNKKFQQKFIEMLAGGIDKKEEEIILEAIRQNYLLDQEQRSLKEIFVAFGLEGFDGEINRPKLVSRLKKWIANDNNNGYSEFFNNSEDNLNFSSNIVCFDMSEVMNDSQLLAPVSFYIFHKFNQIINDNPSPHIFFIDEMQKYLQNPDFNPHIITAIKESRKRNGIFLGCMQEASTLVESQSGDEIITNLATLILFPTPKARAEHYIDGLGLTDSEFYWIKNCPNPRNVMIKKMGSNSVIVDVDLSIIGDYLKLFSSKDVDRKKMEKLISVDQFNWVSNFLNSNQYRI